MFFRKEAKRKEAEDILNQANAIEAGRDALPAGSAVQVNIQVNSGAAASAIHRKHVRKNAAVWSVFDLTKEEPSCLLSKEHGAGCCGAVPASSGGTANYWNHLRIHHRTKWLELQRAAGRLLEAGAAELSKLEAMLIEHHVKVGSVDSVVNTSLPPEAKAIMDRVTANWIIGTNQDKEEASTKLFQVLMQTATSGAYSGACRTTVDGLISASKESGKAKCVRKTQNILNSGIFPSLSGDLWSKNGMALLGLMLHAIDEMVDDGNLKWNMSEWLAGAIPASAHHHTAAWIKGATNTACNQLGVARPEQQLFIKTADQGANMVKAWDPDPCACHLIQTNIRNSWSKQPEVKETQAKGRAQVGYLHHSTIGRSDYLVCGGMLAWNPASIPDQDVCTRWRTWWKMGDDMRARQDINQLFEIRYADTSAAASSYPDNKFNLVNWAINNQGSAVLFGLAQTSDILEGKNYPTSNLIIPMVYPFIDSLDAARPTRQFWNGAMIPVAAYVPAIKEARQMLYDCMYDCWVKNIKPTRLKRLLITTLLDPRSKALQIPSIDDEKRAWAWEMLEMEYISRYSPTQPCTPDQSPAQAQPMAAAAAPAQAPYVAPTLGSFVGFMDLMSPAIPESPVRAAAAPMPKKEIVDEVALYKSLPAEPMDVNILEWWPQRKAQFPFLSQMARQYLSAPASSASCERVFSLAGRLFSDRQQNMTERSLEERMWAKVDVEMP